MLKIVNTTPEDDALLEDLSVSEVGAIVLTGNREFIILGGQNGMTALEGVVSSGQKTGDSSASSITLVGYE
jgi:hypothetical protein